MYLGFAEYYNKIFAMECIKYALRFDLDYWGKSHEEILTQRNSSKQ